MAEKIQIQGLREFQKSLRDMDSALPKQIRLIQNDAAQLIIDWARPRMPSDTGAARSSLRAASTQRAARISMGGRKAPYAPWLDFGGQGRARGRPPARPFIRNGRYVYAGLDARRAEIIERMAQGMSQLATDAGLEVS